MKSKLLTAALGAAVLLVLTTCDTSTTPAVPSPEPPVSPFVFSVTWREPGNSVNDIVRGPRYLEIKSDWSFVYTGGDIGDFSAMPPDILGAAGGFSQAKQELDLSGMSGPANYPYYPPIIVEGKLVYDGDGYYIMAPESGRVDLRMLQALDKLTSGGTSSLPDYNELPDSTVENFREYAKISFDDATKQLVIDDHPDSVTGGIGFLNGTWTKLP